MKKNLLIYAAMAVVFLVFSAFQFMNTSHVVYENGGDKFSIPEDVNTILEESCFGCHNSEAQSDKAKKKLMIDQMGDLSSAKLVGQLSDISEVVENKDMPPEKFLEKYPDKALSEEAAKRLKEWADQTAEELMK